MKHILITTIAAISLLVTTAFADPIHDAAKAGDTAGVQAELDKGVDPNAPGGGSGVTPLHWAAMWGHTEVAELLIGIGAHVDRTDNSGNIALHYAALGAGFKQTKRGDQKGVAELLIVNGANVNVRRGDGKTPLDRANDSGGVELADLLREHDGKTGDELALMPRLEYSKNEWPFDFRFTAKREKTYVVEVTQDFKQWDELETIKGTGKQVVFIDSRNSAEILLEQHTSKHGGFGIRTWATDGENLKSFDETKGQYEILSPPEFAERFGLDYPIKQFYRARLVE